MRRVLLCVVLAWGCGKKAADPATDPEGVAGAESPRLDAPDGAWVRGPVRVQVHGARVLDADDVLLVFVSVYNTDPKLRLSLTNWFDTPNRTSLRDDIGNAYRPARRGTGAGTVLHRMELADDFGSGLVYPDRHRSVGLLFDRPVPAAEYLYLDLDGRNLDGQGFGLPEAIQFRIPREMWAPPPRVKTDPKKK